MEDLMKIILYFLPHFLPGPRHGRDRRVAGLTTTCAISAYHHQRCDIESHSW